jgi:hypothetical protein
MKKQLKEIQKIEKKVSKVCDTKKTVEVTRNDDGIIINKETGKPHFGELEDNSTDIVIRLGYGESSPSLKKQIKNQGYNLSEEIYNNIEEVRVDLLALKDIGILKEKDLIKCLKRLNKKISLLIIKSELKEGESATHIHTKVS